MVNYQVFSGKFFSDFADLREKIGYFKELGISNVWTTPFLDAPSYHGYDTLDYYTPKKEYGSLEDFKRMTNTYNENNIGIIMDLVICHTSKEHPWFKKSVAGEYPFNNFYVWSEKELSPHELIGNEDQSASNLHKWTWCEEKEMFYYCPFSSDMPSLNLNCKELRDEIDHIVYYWLKLGVTGFRLDAVLHAIASKQENISFWHWFRKTVKKYKKDAILVGEAWTNAENMADYSNALGSCFNFDVQSSMQWHVNNNQLRTLPSRIKELNDKSGWANHIESVFLSNHDQDRIMHVLGNDINKMKTACAFLLTTKGIPYIYYGEEIGMAGYKYFGDEGVRQPMDWHEVWKQRNESDSLFNLYKDLINIRNGSKALKYGNLIPCWSDNDECATFLRSFYNEKIYIIINNKDNSKPEIPHAVYNVLYSSINGNTSLEYSGESFAKGIYLLELL